MKILIIKMGALGDVLRTTFVAAGIKEKYTSSHITWLTKENAEEILKNNPSIDRILTWNHRTEVLTKQFDGVLSLDDEVEVCAFASKIKTKKLQGAYLNNGKRMYTPDVEQWFGMGLLRPEEKGGKAKADELKKLNRRTFQEIYAEMFGISETHNKKPILHLTPHELRYAEPILTKVKPHSILIGINSGAGIRWKLKMLSIEKTAEVCNSLAQDTSNTILLLGGCDELERNQSIKSLCPSDNIILVEPTKSIREFASIINLCKIIITSDSLALHLSHALDKYTIGFFGPTSPWEVDMFGKGVCVYKESDCLCCYKKTTETKPDCIERIMPMDIIGPCNTILSKITPISQ